MNHLFIFYWVAQHVWNDILVSLKCQSTLVPWNFAFYNGFRFHPFLSL